MLLIVLGVIIIVTLFYLYWASSFGHWKKLGVPHEPPHFLWGNLKDVVYQKKPILEVYQNIYRSFRDVPYVGVYVVNRAGLLIRDPQLIKEVAQTSFASFHDNDLSIDEKVDPIFANNPFTMTGEKWKERRAAHTAQFSSGKTKNIFASLCHSGERMSKFLNDEIDKNGKFVINAMELSVKFTIYNFGNYGLGIDPKTFDEDNPELRRMARQIIEPNLYNGLKQQLIFLMPKLSHLLTVRLIPNEVTEKFKQLITEQLKYRGQNKIVRNDFLDGIQEYKGLKTSLEDMTVQVGGFFLDTFATNSTLLSFILYELAANVFVQQRLAEEIDAFLENLDGEIQYQDLQELPYLTAVVSEGLRKHPPLAVLIRVCTKPHTFPPVHKGGEPIKVEVGMPVVLPVIALHNDEKYFPDPEKFDPTRFLSENKEKLEDSLYMPFGEGPRTCLGKRFALLQSKMMIFKLVSEFEFRLDPKTKTPLEYDHESFLLAAKGGVWINIYKRRR